MTLRGINRAGQNIRGLDLLVLWRPLIRPEAGMVERIVPPTGHTATLSTLTAAAMAFLAVFALTLTLATERLAQRWSDTLASTMTVRISAPADQIEDRSAAAMGVLKTTPGVAGARLLPDSEIEALLRPWFGPDIPIDALPIRRLIELHESGDGLDSDGLRLRLTTQSPGAVLDDHTRWRKPLVSAARRLWVIGWFSLLLITTASAGMITLATQASLAANRQVIRVLRLIGVRDIIIATAFVRRFTRRAGLGAAAGTALGMLVITVLPRMNQAGGFLTGLGFQGWDWLWPLLIPLVSAGASFLATRWAALRILREVR